MRRRTTNQISFQKFCTAFSQGGFSSVLLGAEDLWRKVQKREALPGRDVFPGRLFSLARGLSEEAVAEEGISEAKLAHFLIALEIALRK